jgi:sugar phosphate isomerase/epimerase
MELCVFSKRLQSLGFSALGRALRGVGVEGVDLTVRPGGHVEPEAVKDRLPEAANALKAEGVKTCMISTGITSADEPHARATFETAARLGIGHIKLGYFPYRGMGTLRKSLAESRAKLRGLAVLAAENGVFAGCHNHSGACIGANLVHVREMIEDLDPRAIGIYFDPAHAFVEGLCQGWKQMLDDVGDRVRMLAIKDMVVGPDGQPRSVPMGQGLVRWLVVIEALKKKCAGQLEVVSIHAESELPSVDAALQLAASDTAYFADIWNSR